jgi:hypothetical protein
MMDGWEYHGSHLAPIVVHPEVVGIVCESFLDGCYGSWDVGFGQGMDLNWHLGLG